MQHQFLFGDFYGTDKSQDGTNALSMLGGLRSMGITQDDQQSSTPVNDEQIDESIGSAEGTIDYADIDELADDDDEEKSDSEKKDTLDEDEEMSDMTENEDGEEGSLEFPSRFVLAQLPGEDGPILRFSELFSSKQRGIHRKVRKRKKDEYIPYFKVETDSDEEKTFEEQEVRREPSPPRPIRRERKTLSVVSEEEEDSRQNEVRDDYSGVKKTDGYSRRKGKKGGRELTDHRHKDKDARMEELMEERRHNERDSFAQVDQVEWEDNIFWGDDDDDDEVMEPNSPPRSTTSTMASVASHNTAPPSAPSASSSSSSLDLYSGNYASSHQYKNQRDSSDIGKTSQTEPVLWGNRSENKGMITGATVDGKGEVTGTMNIDKKTTDGITDQTSDKQEKAGETSSQAAESGDGTSHGEQDNALPAASTSTPPAQPARKKRGRKPKPRTVGGVLIDMQTNTTKKITPKTNRRNAKQIMTLQTKQTLDRVIQNEDLMNCEWMDRIVWDDELGAKQSPLRQVIFDLNDKNMIFLDEDRSSRSQDHSLQPKKLRKNASARTIQTMLWEQQEQEIEREAEKFNLSNDHFYRGLSDLKVRQKIGLRQVTHSIPALSLSKSFFRTHLPPEELRYLHRPRHGLPVGVKMAISYRPPRKEKKRRSRPLEKKNDMSVVHHRFFLAEYVEERPPLLSNKGMASLVINYYKKPKGEPGFTLPQAPDGVTKSVDSEESVPVIGDLKEGQLFTTLENEMYGARMFPVSSNHVIPRSSPEETESTPDKQPKQEKQSIQQWNRSKTQESQHHLYSQRNTMDFILASRRTARGGVRFYIRSVPAIYAVGHTQPQIEVPAPLSRPALNFVRNRLAVDIFRKFKKKEQKDGVMRLKIDDIKDTFPSMSETTIRKRLKDVADFQRGGDDSGWWTLKKGLTVPTEEELRRMLTPENVCAYESMLAGEQRLKDAGVTQRASMASFASAVDVRLHGKPHLKRTIKFVERERMFTPWNMTSNFVNALNGKDGIHVHLISAANENLTKDEMDKYSKELEKASTETASSSASSSSSSGVSASDRVITNLNLTSSENIQRNLPKISQEEAKIILFEKGGFTEERVNKMQTVELINNARKLLDTNAEGPRARGGQARTQKFREILTKVFNREADKLSQNVAYYSDAEERASGINDGDSDTDERRGRDNERKGEALDAMSLSSSSDSGSDSDDIDSYIEDLLQAQETDRQQSSSSSQNSQQQRSRKKKGQSLTERLVRGFNDDDADDDVDEDQEREELQRLLDEKSGIFSNDRESDSEIGSVAGTGKEGIGVEKTHKKRRKWVKKTVYRENEDGERVVARVEEVRDPKLVEYYIKKKREWERTGKRRRTSHHPRDSHNTAYQSRKERRRLQDQYRRWRKLKTEPRKAFASPPPPSTTGAASKGAGDGKNKPSNTNKRRRASNRGSDKENNDGTVPTPMNNNANTPNNGSRGRRRKIRNPNIRCGRCGERGHMQTNKQCPLRQQEEEEEEDNNSNNKTSQRNNDGEASTPDPSNLRIKLPAASISKPTNLKLRIPQKVMQTLEEKKALKSAKRKASQEEIPEYLQPAPKRRRRRVTSADRIAEELQRILDRLRSQPEARPFLRPVNLREYPDYRRVVSQPMDLSRIQRRISDLEYLTPEQFLDDVQLMADNAHAYCDSRFPAIPPQADELLKLCEQELDAAQDHIQQLLDAGPSTPATPATPSSSYLSNSNNNQEDNNNNNFVNNLNINKSGEYYEDSNRDENNSLNDHHSLSGQETLPSADDVLSFGDNQQ
eukprot:gb/GECH01010124.1/.p1 GENE.gb/GECH01010124.1/~~gb/GECH01010124.1/.p1  ORF type:complete len:1777 (+),score=403.86 gb/GECH01010124.1/:1-5331(+)